MFILERSSNKNGLDQYRNYMVDQALSKNVYRNIYDIKNCQLKEIRKAIDRHSIENQNAIYQAVSNVSGTLELGIKQLCQGMESIGNSLENIEFGIDSVNNNLIDLYSLIDWRTNLIIDNQKTSNHYLSLISEGVFLPEDKKLNIYYCKQGNIFLTSALNNLPDCQEYEMAFMSFSQALTYDKTDYLSLKQLGLIHLNSIRRLDIIAAEKCFKDAAYFASVYNSQNPTNSSNSNTASCYYYASYCNYYILENYVEALILIRKAISFDNNFKHKFHLSKCLVLNGKGDEAAEILRELIKIDKFYSVEITSEPDLNSNPAIQAMLAYETAKIVKQVDDEIFRINNNLLRNFNDPVFTRIVTEIQDSFNPKTYLNARTAKEKLKI